MKNAGSSITNTSVDDLTERISVRYFETERNERGDILKVNEVERCKLWAKILPMSGRISDKPPERTNKINYRVTIRYRSDISTNDEILWRRRRLKLLTPPIDVESRKIFTTMDCEEVIEDVNSEEPL